MDGEGLAPVLAGLVIHSLSGMNTTLGATLSEDEKRAALTSSPPISYSPSTDQPSAASPMNAS